VEHMDVRERLWRSLSWPVMMGPIFYWEYKMKATIKRFLAGLIVGAVLAFPLGINFGRDEPLLSNPLKQTDLTDKVTENVKEKASELVDEAKETIHDATRPAQKEWQR